jgi:TolB protein
MRLVVVLLFLLSISSAAQIPNPERLTNINNSYPAISPDGSTIVFQSDRSGRGELFTMKPDGTDVKQITNLSNNIENSSWMPSASPSWSPDGKQIAFVGNVEPDNPDIFIMNADGSGLRRLTAFPGDDSHPHWAANGRIVFNSAQTTPDLKAEWSRQWHEVFSINPDGTDLRQHTRCKTVCTYPSLSPDGNKILFRKVLDTPGFNWDLSSSKRNSEVFVADVNGENEVNISNSAAFDGWPMWSPDSKRLLFTSNRMGPANVGHIFLVNADGSGLTQLSSGSWSYQQASWSHDGKKIYAYQNHAEYGFGDVAVFEVLQ